MEPFSADLLPFVIAGFAVSFLLAFGVGANDVANSFGTSVGSKVLTLRGACILGTIFEILGAILVGYKVSDTVRKGILDVSLYNNTEKELMLGSLSALGGSAVWNLLATSFSLPISGTHTIVGATLGFSMCARGTQGVNWFTFGKIVASWFVSPILSGAISAAIYFIVHKSILSKPDPIPAGLRALPLFYGFTILVNVFSIVHDGPQMLLFDRIPLWGALLIAVGLSGLVMLGVQFVLVPYTRRGINAMIDERERKKGGFTFGSEDNSRDPTPPRDVALENGKGRATTYSFSEDTPTSNGYAPASVDFQPSHLTKRSASSSPSDKMMGLTENVSQLPLVEMKDMAAIAAIDQGIAGKMVIEEETPEVGKLFSFLQILTATFGSFAHGGNDVSNAIGPLIALWAIYTEGSVAQKSEPPVYILLYGGLGISAGLWVWGRKVIKTIGEDLTKMTPSSGFSIEIGSAFTVLAASKCGLPISTTHCKVGSVVFVGWTKSTKEGVDWSLFRNIVIAWIVTVPLTAAISALLMFLLSTAFL